MYLRTSLAIAGLVVAPSAVRADHPLLCKAFHHCHDHCCSPDCQVHIHYCKPPAEEYAPPVRQVRDISPQMIYAPVLPSTVGYTMPMMPMMQMPMMQMGMMPAMQMQQPQYVQMQLPAPQQQQAPQRSTAEATCGECEPRVARLEDGVKNLSARMDKIEQVLENQTRALEGILTKLNPPQQ